MTKKTKIALLVLIILVLIGALLALVYKIRTDKQREITQNQINVTTVKAKSQFSIEPYRGRGRYPYEDRASRKFTYFSQAGRAIY